MYIILVYTLEEAQIVQLLCYGSCPKYAHAHVDEPSRFVCQLTTLLVYLVYLHNTSKNSTVHIGDIQSQKMRRESIPSVWLYDQHAYTGWAS